MNYLNLESEKKIKLAKTTVNINNKRIADFLICQESEIDAEFIINKKYKSKF